MNQSELTAPSGQEADFTEISYLIDEEDRLVWAGAEWEEFANRNGGANLAPEKIVGRLLWEFVSDETTRELYRKVLEHARQGATTNMFLRCDGPAQRRLIEMIISRRPGGKVEFTTALLSTKARPEQRFFDSSTPRTADSLCVCSWCNQVRIPRGTWHEVEVAMECMQLTHETALPQLEAAVCPVCAAAVDYALKTSRPALDSAA